MIDGQMGSLWSGLQRPRRAAVQAYSGSVLQMLASARPQIMIHEAGPSPEEKRSGFPDDMQKASGL